MMMLTEHFTSSIAGSSGASLGLIVHHRPARQSVCSNPRFAQPACRAAVAPGLVRRGSLRIVVQAYRAGAGELHDPWKEEERRKALLNYVQSVEPTAVNQFMEQAAPNVVQAMQQTINNVVGSLPPQYFEVKINTVAESLAQLMLSIMTTGYMFRSAQFRMELQAQLQRAQLNTPTAPPPTPPGSNAASSTASTSGSSASAAAGPKPAVPRTTSPFTDTSGSISSLSSADLADVLPGGGLSSSSLSSSSAATAASSLASAMSSSASSLSPSSSGSLSGSDAASSSTSSALLPLAASAASFLVADHPEFAPGVQKSKVEGEVMRWHHEAGLQRLPARAYIEALEAEVAALRQQLAAVQGAAATGALGATAAAQLLPPLGSMHLDMPLDMMMGGGASGPVIDTTATPASSSSSSSSPPSSQNAATPSPASGTGASGSSSAGSSAEARPKIPDALPASYITNKQRASGGGSSGPLSAAGQWLANLNPFKTADGAADNNNNSSNNSGLPQAWNPDKNKPSPGMHPPPRTTVEASRRAAAMAPFMSGGKGAKAGAGTAGAGAAGIVGFDERGYYGGPPVMGNPLGGPRNDLMEYVKGLQSSGGLKDLASTPHSSAVKEAMEVFVGRLMGTADPEVLRHMDSEFSALELSKVLMWLMVVGYTLRGLECRRVSTSVLTYAARRLTGQARLDLQDSLGVGVDVDLYPGRGSSKGKNNNGGRGKGTGGPGGLLPGL